MNGKVLLLTAVMMFAIFTLCITGSFAICQTENTHADSVNTGIFENETFDGNETVGPQGIPIDTPGMPR